MTDPLSIGLVVQRYGGGSVGGAEKFTVDLASGLASEGHRIEVLTSCATSYADWANVLDPGVVREAGVTVTRLPVTEPRPNDRFMPLHLRMVDKSQPPLWPFAQKRWCQMMGPELSGGAAEVAAMSRRVDVVVFVGYHYAHSLTLLPHAAVHAPTVLIPTAHPEGAFHTAGVRAMFPFTDRVICLADAEAQLVNTLYGCADRTDVVGCPVEPIEAPTRANVAGALRRHGVGSGPYLVTIGRVDPAKGSDEAVLYSSMVRKSVVPDLRLVVVGPGDLGVSGAGVVSTGFVTDEDKIALIAGASALLQPSYMESFSLALMEGWLLRRPALVQGRNGVLAGHVRASGGGAVYEDYLSFESAVVALTRSEDLRSRLGAAGNAYVRSEFNWDRVSRGFLQSLEHATRTGRQRLMGASHSRGTGVPQ